MNSKLKIYFPVVDIIAGTFGSECEVALHDLSNPKSSVIYVANGNVTGRRIGQSFDHLVKQVLLNKNFEKDRVINYTFKTIDNKIIKSSSALLRDEDDLIIGMICINYDVSLYIEVQKKIDMFLLVDKQDEPIEHEDITPDIEAIIDELILKIVGKVDPETLNRKKCIQIVSFMDEKGIFLVKGAIDKVAEALGVSKVTVYSYLDEAKSKNKK